MRHPASGQRATWHRLRGPRLHHPDACCTWVECRCENRSKSCRVHGVRHVPLFVRDDGNTSARNESPIRGQGRPSRAPPADHLRSHGRLHQRATELLHRVQLRLRRAVVGWCDVVGRPGVVPTGLREPHTLRCSLLHDRPRKRCNDRGHRCRG